MAYQSKTATLRRKTVDCGTFSPASTAHLSDAEFREYVSFVRTMVSNFQPVGEEEALLARRVAETMFRINQIINLEVDTFTSQLHEKDLIGGARSAAAQTTKALHALRDEQDRLWDSFQSDCDRLEELQTERRKAPRAKH